MSDMMKRYYRARGVRVPDNDNDMPGMQRVIAEQAVAYGLTALQHKRFTNEMAVLQEIAEFEQWEF